MTNRDVAELLARKAEEKEGDWAKALRRAARLAHVWPEEAAAIHEAGRPLTEMAGVGPAIAGLLGRWLEEPPPVPEPDTLRRDFLTLAEARADLADGGGAALRGDLQMHTLWSDGSTTVAEMARGAAALGHKYIAITDHSKGLKIAGGIDEAALLEQEAEITAVNAELEHDGLSLRVLRSLEMNVSPQGAGDMSPESLARLDLVLGSFHSQLRKKEDQTERYLAAVENPDIQVLGHPRGRIYNFRLGLSADWPRVFARVAELGKAVECDCYPDRQDLNVELLRVAAAEGCFVSIGTDSHHPVDLRNLDLGAAAVRRAGVEPERVLNHWPADRVIQWARALRESGAAAD